MLPFSLLLLSLFSSSFALNNNMGLLPEMGLNSWYMLHGHLQNYIWESGYCASDDYYSILQFVKQQGLWDLGYTWANWDDCIVTGRDPVSHQLIPDARAFPQGPKAVADKFKALGFSMGWYTVRGLTTCASGPPPRLERPGSAGYEDIDAAFYASIGVTYLKDDTCGNPETP
jgi:alpha-galactosidase